MQLTQEQKKIIQTISNKDCNFIKINAVSGSGKTSSLIAIAQHLNVKQGLYISYNKAIATEASEKFGPGIQCKTIHSLAYGFTVKHFSLKLVSTLKARIITERIPYIKKALLLETLSKYFLSRHITIQSFVESEYSEGIFSQEDIDLMKHYFIKMKEGRCDCSHDFYLKLFHILLHHGIIKTPEYELLMLDEAGDVNGTSLEIFRLINAKKRIMVGDSCLPGNSKIKTSTGWRNILSIVKDIESKKEVKVWSYNHNSDIFEFKKAIGSLRTGKKQCYKLKTTRSSLECTANHKIATPYGYKRLDELKVGDLILKDGDEKLSNTKTTLNNDQYQVLLGSFLGDGHIDYQDKLKKVGRLNVSHSEKQKNYLDWKAKTFNSETSLSQESCEKTINGSKCIIQNQFSFISKLFVLEETITLKSIEKLDLLGLAVWVMDDGSLRNSYNKDDIKFSITIDSNSFSLGENNYLVSILKNNFNLDATVQKTRDFYRISFNKENSIKIRELIKPFVSNDFTGKFKHKDSTVEDLNNKNVNYTVDVITSISKTRTTETYDIEVEDNHNFIASMTAQKSTACGILVHNCQNIYSFNNTINGFKALENEGMSLKLTQSFRVSDQLAPFVEEFCHQYLDSTMEFRGVHYNSKPAKEDQTIFYIARTNGGIIEKMIELEEEHTPYNLTRPVKAIFQLPLILLMLSKDWKTEVYVEEYKFLEHDAKEFANDPELQKQFKESILTYFANEHADDPSVMSAINLIMRFGPQKIFACNKKALEHEKHHETHKVTITSAHSSKGLQADIVHILPDMNGALDKIVAKQHEYIDNMIQIDKTSNKNWTFDPIKYEYFDKKQPNMELLSKQAQEEFRLYYVVITRTKYDLYDAEWLSEPDFITMFQEDSSINLRGTFND